MSSFLAAASAVKCEYTVPDVAQTVIITRMPGRTPVPDNESIAKLAQHGTSMAVFLSSSHLEELKEELYKDFNLYRCDDIESLITEYVKYYNTERPSTKCGRKSPVQFKTEQGFA